MPAPIDPKYRAADGFKRCNKCERVRPVSDFYKKKGTIDSYMHACKGCISARGRGYYEANRERQIEYSREWYRQNPEKARERRADWYERKGRELARQRRQSMTAEERAQVNEEQRAARAADPERFRLYDLKSRLRKFGVTLAEYEALMEMQGGVCAICKGPPSGKDDVFHVDHDHQTGTLRGLLCHYCNTSLGGFRDDIAILQRAIEYLMEPPFRRIGTPGTG